LSLVEGGAGKTTPLMGYIELMLSNKQQKS
jgi:hypothetical protein